MFSICPQQDGRPLGARHLQPTRILGSSHTVDHGHLEAVVHVQRLLQGPGVPLSTSTGQYGTSVHRRNDQLDPEGKS